MSRFSVQPNEKDFRVDDGLRVLYDCPCCGLRLSEKAAKVLADKLNNGELTWESTQAMILLRGRQAHEPAQ